MLKNYLKIALRNILRHKGYSLINVLGLAIGMACCILILLYVQDELSYDRYHENADRVYRLATDRIVGDKSIQSAQTPTAWGPALVSDYSEVVSMVRFKTPNSRWLIKYEEKEFWEKGFFFADSTVFDIFSYSFVQGNPRTALNGPNKVVINESTARKYFGDDNPMGKIFNAEDFLMLTVTGIVEDMPENSHFHYDFLVSFASLGPGPGSNMYGNLYNPEFRGFQATNPIIYTYLMLQEGASAVAFEEKLPAFIEKYLQTASFQPFLQPITDIHLHSALNAEMEANSDIQYIYIFSALALIIIIIACINFMNLATARSANRAREVGMRKVVGANRSHLIRQFIGESMVLAVIALVVSIGLCYLMLPFLNYLAEKSMTLDFGDGTLVAGLVGIALVVGFLAGSYPAFFLSSFQPVTVLKGSMKAGAGNTMLRKVLVVGQFAMSILMIVGTVTVYNQLDYVRNKKLGFNKEHVVTLRLANIFISQRYDQSFKNVVIEHPDILGATGASSMPGDLIGTASIREKRLTLQALNADYDYIPTMGIELAAGRNYSRDFGTDAQEAIILNETAVRELGWDDPVGKKITFTGPQANERTVIGVVKDFHMKSLHQKIEPLMMFGVEGPGNLWYASIRIRGENIREAMAFIEQKWEEVFFDFPYEFSFLDEDYDNLYKTEQQLQQVFGAFAIFSILITCLGLFGLGETASDAVVAADLAEANIDVITGAEATPWAWSISVPSWAVRPSVQWERCRSNCFRCCIR